MMAKRVGAVMGEGDSGLGNHYKHPAAHCMALLSKKFRVNIQSSTTVADRLALFLLSL